MTKNEAAASRDLARLTRRLMQRDSTGEPGRVVLLIGAAPKVGCSTMARAIALIGAGISKRGVWLIDLDFWTNGQLRALERQGDLLGAPGFPRDGVLNGEAFWRINFRSSDRPQNLLQYRQIGNRNLFVSDFKNADLTPKDDVQILPAPGYWNEARILADLVVVDAPSLAASRAGLALSAQADVSLLVVGPDRALAADAIFARDEILARGGKPAGIIFNRAAQRGAHVNKVA